MLLVAGCTQALADDRFSGPYGGLSLGYVKGDDSNVEYDDNVANGYTAKTEPEGVSYGVVVGYNWAVADNIMLGVEADYQLANEKDLTLFDYNGVPDADYPVSTELKNALSVRARAGYLFNANQTMAYVSAGYASAELKRSYFSGAFSQSSTDRQDGWTAGIGIEHAPSDSLSVQVEYRYSDYGNIRVSSAEVYGNGYTEGQDYNQRSLNMAVIYHFN